MERILFGFGEHRAQSRKCIKSYAVLWGMPMDTVADTQVMETLSKLEILLFQTRDRFSPWIMINTWQTSERLPNDSEKYRMKRDY
jgi:hypothetical protein